MASRDVEDVGCNAIDWPLEVAWAGVACQEHGSGWCARIARFVVIEFRVAGGVVDPKATVYVVAR